MEEFINQLDSEELQNGYFQHDGATAHTAQKFQVPKEFYDDRLISSHTDNLYPPRSPDLTPLDYFLFLTVKNTIFKESVDAIEDLKVRIKHLPNTYLL